MAFSSSSDNDDFVLVQHKKRSLRTCGHCGKTGPKSESFCDCEEIIEHFGDIKCTICQRLYGLPVSIEKYTNEVSKGNKEDTFKNYWSWLEKRFAQPCPSCHPAYIEMYYQTKNDYNKWSQEYLEEYGYPDDWIDDDYYDDEPCRSSSGMCPCCGDCP